MNWSTRSRQAAAEDHSVAPIMVAHVVKTAQAAIEESRALGGGPRMPRPYRGGGQVPRQPEAGAVRLPVNARSDRCDAGRGEA